MNFLSPEFLWLLLAVPALVAGYVLLLRRSRHVLRYASLRVVKDAISPGRQFRRHIPPLRVQLISGLSHSPALDGNSYRVRQQKVTAGEMMETVHRSGFVPMKPRSIAREGDQVGQGNWFLRGSEPRPGGSG